jgi:hypothetical protein
MHPGPQYSNSEERANSLQTQGFEAMALTADMTAEQIKKVIIHES